MSKPDVHGCVLVVHEPGVEFARDVLPAVRSALSPATSSMCVAPSKTDTSSLSFLWYPTSDSCFGGARLVLARLACLSTVYSGTAIDSDFIGENRPARKNIDRMVRGADVVLYVFRRDKPETLNQLDTWKRLIDSKRAEVIGGAIRPAADCALIGINMSNTSPRVSEGTMLDVAAKKLFTQHTMMINGPYITTSDADKLALVCVKLLVECCRKRQGLSVQTTRECPGRGCSVRIAHQHLVSDDDFMGEEETIVFLREEINKQVASPQAEMPSGSTLPRQYRTILPNDAPPTKPTPTLATPIARVVPKQGSLVPNNGAQVRNEKTPLLARVAKR